MAGLPAADATVSQFAIRWQAWRVQRTWLRVLVLPTLVSTSITRVFTPARTTAPKCRWRAPGRSPPTPTPRPWASDELSTDPAPPTPDHSGSSCHRSRPLILAPITVEYHGSPIAGVTSPADSCVLANAVLRQLTRHRSVSLKFDTDMNYTIST